MHTHEGMMNQIRAQIDQVPLTFLEAQMFHAYVEACQRSWIWQEDVAIDVPAGGVADINLTNGADVAHVIAAFNGMTQLRPSTYVQARMSDWTGAPAFYDFSIPDGLRIWPLDSAESTYTLRLYLALQPSGTYAALPEGLLIHGFDMFLSTALARLYALPNRPWTSEQLAILHGRRSRALQNEMRVRVLKQFSSEAAIAWRFPQFV